MADQRNQDTRPSDRSTDLDRGGQRRRRSSSMFDWSDEDRRRQGGGQSGSDARDPSAERPTSAGAGKDERIYGSDNFHSGLPTDETSKLIASNKVEGTSVVGRDGKELGSIFNFMVDKRSGHVEYAVMRHGGFLGLGERYYPLPWRALTYHTDEGGYLIDMTEHELKNAPSFDRDTEPEFDDRYGEHVRSHYGLNR